MPHLKAKTINETLREAAQRIPADEAAYLLRWVLGVREAWLFLHGDEAMPDEAAGRFSAAAERRVEGEPVAYIEGRRGFWNLDLEVSPDTLIPRVETERLVEAALALIPEGAPCDVLDLGTGSGAIALAIAQERPLARVLAVDRSAQALQVARRNAERHHLTRVAFVEGSWFEPVGNRKFHCIVSNPPYIRDDDAHLTQGDLRFEPRTALSSGTDGLDDIRRIVSAASRYLHAHGALLLEHGFDQGAAVRELLSSAGFVAVETLQDLEARDRVSSGLRRPD